MPRASKRPRTAPPSPLKQSSTDWQPRAGPSSARASSSRTTPRRKDVDYGAYGTGGNNNDERSDAGDHGLARFDPSNESPGGFIKASSGDAYFLQATTTSKTSDELLSTHIDPEFSITEYTDELTACDESLDHAPRRERTGSYQRKYFRKWLWEMSQGFNILLHGFGSKRQLATAFAEKASSRGHVVVVNGYDPASGLGEIILALEEVVKQALRDDENEVATGPVHHGRKGTSSGAKGKGKAAPDTPAARGNVSTSGLAPALSAFESRSRRFIQLLADAPSSMPPIYLIINSLDSPTLRPPKIMSLLALLAAQPRLHLLATVDHVRATLLFPTSMSVTRPPHMSHRTTINADESDMTEVLQSIRTFCFIPYATPTFEPYTTEVLHSSTLSHLLPPTIFPSALDAAMDGGAGGTASASMTQSTLHVLASVTDRAKRVFVRLAQEQIGLFEALDDSERKQVAVTGPTARDGLPAPVVASSLDR